MDNSKCSKRIDKYKLKLIRSLQVYKLNQPKPFFTANSDVVSIKQSSQCKANGDDSQTLQLEIPKTLFIDDIERFNYKVPNIEKHLEQGPTASFNGRLYSVQYYLEFSLKHDVAGAKSKTMPESMIPITIMTPSFNVMSIEKS